MIVASETIKGKRITLWNKKEQKFRDVNTFSKLRREYEQSL